MEEKKEKKRWFISKLFIGTEEREEEKEEKKADDIIKDSFIADNKCGPQGCNLIIESMQSPAEAHYFWFINLLKGKNEFNLKYDKIYKIKDAYTAGEASSLWGSQEQRKGLQQDKVSQYMATIGKMIKDTFQIVRELRILDERLTYYDEYNEYVKGNKSKESGAVALKGTWVDLVEGGTKNPASVFGLASQVNFVTLPDLFFTVTPKNKDVVDKEVNKLKGKGINRKVREVLGRKLFQFIVWKEKTEKELRDRKIFILNYLRMHVNNIKLYTGWIKPYLRAIKQLQAGSTSNTPYVASTFETSQVELEVMAVGENYEFATDEGYLEDFKFTKYFPCIIIKLDHITLPQMSFQREFQRGPVHTGRTEIKILPYVLTQEQIDQYKAAKDKEVFDEVSDLIPSMEEALKTIGDDLDKYLKQAEKTEKKQEEPEKKQEGLFKPFISLKDGVKYIFSSQKKKQEISKKRESIEKDTAKGIASAHAFILYDVYKKNHGMMAQ